MSIRTKFAATAALILVAATWASSASALVITGKFYLTESVPARSTQPGNTFVGHYTTVDFDDSMAMAGDNVDLSAISIADLYGGFFFSDFLDTPLAVLGSPTTVVALSGTAVSIQSNPMHMAMLFLGIRFGNPDDATFGAVLKNDQGWQMSHGHQSVPEPTSFALLSGGLLAFGAVGTRRRKQT